MANFASVANVLEGIIGSQLNAGRSNQGVWEWYNALQRIVSANRVTGTVRVVGPTLALDAGTVVDVDTGPITLFGALVDNPNAAEAVYAVMYNLLTGSVTVGTDLIELALRVPSATMETYLFPGGRVFDVAASIHSQTGTAAALESTTGVTGTNPTYILVYTEA